MKCCICRNVIDKEEPAILTHSNYGNPRCLCASCEALLDTVIEGRDGQQIRGALATLADLRIQNGDLDRPTGMTLTQIMKEATERATAIEEGRYEQPEVCAEDTVPSEAASDATTESSDEDASVYDIPEELRELAEDRELDRIEAEREHAFDKHFQYVWMGVIAAFLAAVVYFLFIR